MVVKYLFNMMLPLLMTLVFSAPVLGGAPTEQVKETTDKILAILTDPALKAPEMIEEKKRMIRKVVDERFDWAAISRRALGRHWKKMTTDEKKTFIPLFGQMLEQTYLSRVGEYSGEKVSYVDEKVDGTYGVVKVKIKSDTHGEISVKYRVWNKKGQWFIYDISIEGVSLVNNYRSQFNNILMKSTPSDLIKKLEEKVKSETVKTVGNK
jgi:phospholipid transport system substrate-binding protein